MARRNLWSVVALVTILFAGSAFAENFTVSWSGPYGSGSGTIQASGGVATGISATQNGSSLTLLAPNTYGQNDNSVQPWDYYGLAFTDGTNQYNIYQWSGYFECSSAATNCQYVNEGTFLNSFGLTALSSTDYSVSWSGDYGNGSGTITTSGGIATSISATQNGSPLTLLAPNAYGVNDNSVQPWDSYGVAFTDGSADYNIYYYSGYFECSSAATNCQYVNEGQFLDSFSITPTPEPASSELLAAALLAFAFLGITRLVRIGFLPSSARG